MHGLIDIPEIVDKVERSSQEDSNDPPHHQEQNDCDREVEPDVHRRLYADAADHRQIVCAEITVQFMTRILNILIVFRRQIRAVPDLVTDLFLR